MRICTDKSDIKLYINEQKLNNIFNDAILDILALHKFHAHETIINEDDHIKYLYLLLDGQIGVIPSSEEGKLSLLDIIIPGDIIGDIEYFNNDNYYYNVMALSDCTLLAIPVNSIDKYFIDNILFYKYLSNNLAHKMKRTSYKYSRSLLYPLKNRLAKYLFDLSKIHGSKLPDVHTNQMADYFGVTTRHLRRVLSDMEQDGILEKCNSSINILNSSELEKQATFK